MRTLLSSGVANILAASVLASAALAGNQTEQTPDQKKQAAEETVFVTGSLIPQRIKLKPVGTKTISPVRIIDRREIDSTGRRTTRGALIADPSVRAVGR